MSSSARSASPRRRFPVGLPDCPLRKRLWTGGLPYPIGVLSCGAFFFLALIVLLRSGCWRRRSLLRNLFEARATCGVGRLFAADAPKPTQDGVAIGRVQLDQPRQASGLLRSNQGRSGPAEGIEYDLAASGTVSDRLGDQCPRLDGRMHRQVFPARGSERVDPGIVPNIGAVAPSIPEPKIVGVGGGANFEHQNQPVLATVECPHATVGLVPDAEVLVLG